MTKDILAKDFAFFCVADGRGYVPKAVTALCSIRRFHPDAGYFVIGPFANDPDAMELISRQDLQFQCLDLHHLFRDCEFIDTLNGKWRSECFWWTYAHKVFADKGYKFCCALDGDVLCVSPLELDSLFDHQAPLSGVAKRNGKINSGVLFLHNQRLDEFQFFEKILNIYNNAKICDHPQCSGYCREKGDQGLIWEMQRLHGLRPHILENAYNHMLVLNEKSYLEKNPAAPFDVGKSRLLHLLFKPWRALPQSGPLNSVALDGYNAWWALAEEIWPNSSERASYFAAGPKS